MTLKLNETGLPLPGRELDAWICEHILKWEWDRSTLQDLLIAPDGHIAAAIFHEAPEDEQFAALPPLLPVSTTAAYHQVMETMRGEGGFFDTLDMRDEGLFMALSMPDVHPSYTVQTPWLDTIEKTFAWAVCVCVWKAKGGEG